MIPTTEQFEQLFPYSTDRIRHKYYNVLCEAMQRYEINTGKRIAAFLAQIEEESGSLRYVEEIASGKAYDGRKDLGNMEPEAIEIAARNNSSPGVWFKGHGLIQITGYYNYKTLGEALELDLINNPKLLTDPKYAAESACWYFNTHNCNYLADVDRFDSITKVINGGYTHNEQRWNAYKRNLKVLE